MSSVVLEALRRDLTVLTVPGVEVARFRRGVGSSLRAFLGANLVLPEASLLIARPLPGDCADVVLFVHAHGFSVPSAVDLVPPCVIGYLSVQSRSDGHPVLAARVARSVRLVAPVTLHLDSVVQLRDVFELRLSLVDQ